MSAPVDSRRPFTVAQNTAFVAVAQVFAKLLGFSVVVALTRHYELEAYGRFALAVTFVALFSPLLELGLDPHLTRIASRDPANTPRALAAALGLRLTLAALLLPVILGVSSLMGHSIELRELIANLWLGLACAIIAGTWTAFFRAAGRMDLEAVTTLATRALLLVASLIAIAMDHGLVVVAGAQVIAGVVGLLGVGLLGAAWGWRPEVRAAFRDWPSLLRGGAPFALTSLVVTIYFRIDSVMLGALSGDRAVGLYNAGVNLLFAMLIVSQAIVTSVFPVVARAGNVEAPEVRRLLNRAITFSLAFSVPIAAGGALLGRPLLERLYGPAYGIAGPALAILLATLPVLFLTNLFGHVLGAIGRQRVVLTVSAVNAILNVALNWFAIPRIDYLGAALATLITEICGLTSLLILMRAQLGHLIDRRALLAVGVSTLAMAAVVFLLRTQPLPLSVTVGVAIYAAVLAVTGVLRRSELVALFRRRESGV